MSVSDKCEKVIFQAISELSGKSIEWARDRKNSKWHELGFDDLDNIEFVIWIEDALFRDLDGTEFDTLLSGAEFNNKLTVLEVIESLKKELAD